MSNVQLTYGAAIVKNAYATNDEFREAVRASALSALKELKGSYRDVDIARMISDRIFGFEPQF